MRNIHTKKCLENKLQRTSGMQNILRKKKAGGCSSVHKQNESFVARANPYMIIKKMAISHFDFGSKFLKKICLLLRGREKIVNKKKF